MLVGTTTWDPPNLANAASSSTTVTVTGAAVGDPVVVGFTSITVGLWQISGQVTSTNTVTVTITNHTGGNSNLGSGTLTAVVLK